MRCALHDLLPLALERRVQRAIRVRRQRADHVLVERDRRDANAVRVAARSRCLLASACRNPRGRAPPTSSRARRACGTPAGCGCAVDGGGAPHATPTMSGRATGRARHSALPRALQPRATTVAPASDSTASASSSRPSPVTALNGITCSASSAEIATRSRRSCAVRSLRRELVDLRQHDDGRHADLAEEVEHLPVVVRRVVAHVEQLHDAAQLRARAQIALDQRPPLARFAPSRCARSRSPEGRRARTRRSP